MVVKLAKFLKIYIKKYKNKFLKTLLRGNFKICKKNFLTNKSKNSFIVRNSYIVNNTSLQTIKK